MLVEACGPPHCTGVSGPDRLGRVDADQADVPLAAVLQIDLEGVAVHCANDMGRDSLRLWSGLASPAPAAS